MYNIIADLHTHTIASTHAYSTIAEMVSAAKRKNLYAIAITDHARMTPGAPGEFYFEALCNLPLIQEGVKVITGMEANILDFDGNIDYRPKDNINFLIASVHRIPHISLDNPTIEKCTQMYLNIAHNKYINAIGHPGSNTHKFDYDIVIPEFKKNNKIVEINAKSFLTRKENVQNCREIALACKKFDAPIMVSSDAHFHTEVACFDSALEMLSEINFPEELIINSSVERLEEYLTKHTNIIENRKIISGGF